MINNKKTKFDKKEIKKEYWRKEKLRHKATLQPTAVPAAVGGR